jgi:alpha-galactosidase
MPWVLQPLEVLVFLYAPAVVAIDNGIGRAPPMGWRGWLLFGTSPTQQKMEAVLPALVSKNRSVGGEPTSLCDLGYCSAGLDNNWNKCQRGRNGAKYAYHFNNGTPAVDTSRFPSMSNMTRLAHGLGLTVSWYGNNCGGCREKNATLAMYKGDVAAIGQYGFNGIKLDGCGAEMDLDLWAQLINATGRPVMIENCHWGKTLPNKTWCPFNFYRVSPAAFALAFPATGCFI